MKHYVDASAPFRIEKASAGASAPSALPWKMQKITPLCLKIEHRRLPIKKTEYGNIGSIPHFLVFIFLEEKNTIGWRLANITHTSQAQPRHTRPSGSLWWFNFFCSTQVAQVAVRLVTSLDERSKQGGVAGGRERFVVSCFDLVEFAKTHFLAGLSLRPFAEDYIHCICSRVFRQIPIMHQSTPTPPFAVWGFL